MRQKLYQAKWSASAAPWLRRFFEKPLHRRVRRRTCMRIVRFCRSTRLVLIRSKLGQPRIAVLRMNSASRAGS